MRPPPYKEHYSFSINLDHEQYKKAYSKKHRKLPQLNEFLQSIKTDMQIAVDYLCRTSPIIMSTAAGKVLASEAFFEFVKNSLDAGATQLELSIIASESDVNITISDNGKKPIPENKQGKYSWSNAFGQSSQKKIDRENSSIKKPILGGQNIGLAITDYYLERYNGELFLIANPDKPGATILLSSPNTPAPKNPWEHDVNYRNKMRKTAEAREICEAINLSRNNSRQTISTISRSDSAADFLLTDEIPGMGTVNSFRISDPLRHDTPNKNDSYFRDLDRVDSSKASTPKAIAQRKNTTLSTSRRSTQVTPLHIQGLGLSSQNTPSMRSRSQSSSRNSPLLQCTPLFPVEHPDRPNKLKSLPLITGIGFFSSPKPIKPTSIAGSGVRAIRSLKNPCGTTAGAPQGLSVQGSPVSFARHR